MRRYGRRRAGLGTAGGILMAALLTGCGAGVPAGQAIINVDHPFLFLFLVRSVKSGEILFLGQVTDPQ